MAQTIPGGAYQDANGNWHDANGEPLKREQVAQAEKLLAEQGEQKAEMERVTVLADAQRDPVARALLQQQQALAESRKAAPAKRTAKDDDGIIS